MTIPHTKFLIAAAALLMSWIALLAGKLDGAEFVTVAGLVVGAYNAGNIGATFAHRSGNPKVEP